MVLRGDSPDVVREFNIVGSKFYEPGGRTHTFKIYAFGAFKSQSSKETYTNRPTKAKSIEDTRASTYRSNSDDGRHTSPTIAAGVIGIIKHVWYLVLTVVVFKRFSYFR